MLGQKNKTSWLESELTAGLGAVSAPPELWERVCAPRRVHRPRAWTPILAIAALAILLVAGAAHEFIRAQSPPNRSTALLILRPPTAPKRLAASMQEPCLLCHTTNN